MTKKKNHFIPIFILCFSFFSIALLPDSDKKKDIYNPGLNVNESIKESLKIAKEQNKNILLMFGANWCPWCHRLHELFETDTEISKLLKDKYLLVMVDIGEKKDKPLNRDLVEKLRVEGFGYPALAVIDSRDGKLLVAQSTGILEKGKGYDVMKVLGFLKTQTLN